MDASNDGGESVDQFLARIASLSEKPGPEQAERTKKTEEELLQARKERQARRAERARSLSPSKTGPIPSSKPMPDYISKPTQGIEPPVALTPPSQSRTLGRSGSISPNRERAAVSGLEFSRPLPSPPMMQEPALPTPPPNATGLSRSGTLSWQQRPLSRGGTLRSRPLSVASIPDLGAPSPQLSQQKDAEEVSRKDIATSLGAKDPSWFRQTADRGIGSAAYRKNETESEQPAAFTSRGMRLPGMSSAVEKQSITEPEKQMPPSLPLKSTSILPPDARTALSTDQTSPSVSALASAPPSKSPGLDLPAFKSLDLTISTGLDTPGLGRTSSILSSSGRPPSPTKGLGGFVESAMMKRSDSVSKRWSVQANGGLKRGDSVASARPAQLPAASGFAPAHGRASSRDIRGIREGNSSPLSSSRPVSSHEDMVPITRGRSVPLADEKPGGSEIPTGQVTESSVKRPSELGQQIRPVTPPTAEPLLSRSPSKTMDPRRWSPTKASWLESALNKPPESPRAAKADTPAWRLSMQRAKQDQQSQAVEVSKEVPTKPVLLSKPVDLPTLQEPKTIDPVDAAQDAPKLAPIKKTVLEPSPLQQKTTASKSVLSGNEKQDERPIVPTKRNITPVPLPAKSTEEADSKTSIPAAVKEDKLTMSRTPKSPEPQVDSKAPVLKPKPQTPPKTDFRASLKARPATPTGANDTEPEFKSVFGKLKRTQTQNYVAPDVLKDNIATGKAALNTTGGPQKTKRIDEFKDSILQKKDAMKSGTGAAGRRPEVKSPAEMTIDPIPEALAKRMALQKTGTSSENIETQKQNNISTKPSVMVPKPQISSRDAKQNVASTASSTASAKPSLDDEKTASSIEKPSIGAERSSTLLKSPSENISKTPNTDNGNAFSLRPASGRSTEASKSKVQTASVDPGLGSETTFEPKFPDKPKLAARLNPALAGFLSRSGSPKPVGDSTSNVSAMSVRDTTQESAKEASTELSHMTKARAKGPKRRAPKSGSSSAQDTQAKSKQPPTDATIVSRPTVSSPEPLSNVGSSSQALPSSASISKPIVKSRDISEDLSEAKRQLSAPGRAEAEKPKPPETKRSLPVPPKSDVVQSESSVVGAPTNQSTTPLPVQKTREDSKAKPAVASKSAELRKVSSPGLAARSTEESAPLQPPKPADTRKAAGQSFGERGSANFTTPKKVEVLPDLPSPQRPELHDNKAVLTSSPLATVLPLTPSKSKLNTPKVAKPEMDSSRKPAVITPSKASGLGLQLGSMSKKLAPTPVLTPPPDPEPSASKVTVSPKRFTSPNKSASLIRPQLESFFGALPTAKEKADFDTHAFLSAQNKKAEKPKTLSKQIWEVSGDGKRTAMPPQQEHILFEECMYLCVHSMQSSSGSKPSEVYLWCGDEVSEAAVEDAQLFCRKVARENSAKLEVVRQGKESSEFFQALGGIVIVRRNKSSALYMLCGRRHLGHVAFDEVEFSADSLRTGLPFLISAKFGKLYLWKGKGSDLEDVGCARLIGMDLGLTGEIEEVAEGEEPSNLWESLSSRPVKTSSSHTGQPLAQDHQHPPRLYRIEHDRPKSSGGLGGLWGLRAASPPKQSLKALVEEIAPFAQKDVDGDNIHILDTYQELYVLVGSSAQKPAEFVTAVQIAQEISVLSASVQDRPILPTTYVVIGEPPLHVKSMFRKWRSQKSSTARTPVCVRIAEVVQELGIAV